MKSTRMGLQETCYMGQTQLSFTYFLFLILHLFLKQIRCLGKDQPSGEMKINSRDRTLRGELAGAWVLAKSLKWLHQLWTAYSRTSYDMRITKPFIVRHSRWLFVTISRTCSLTEKQAHTHLSKCHIQQNKVKVKLQMGDWTEENLSLQCSIHSGGRNTVDIYQILFSQLSTFCSFPQMRPCG